MLYQIHHQHKKTGKTSMKAQFEVKEGEKYHDLFRQAFDGLDESHPLPDDNWQWLVCNEKSEDFVWATPP